MPLGRKARQFCRSFSSSSFDPNGIDQKGRSEARDALCFPYGNSVRLALLILAYFVNGLLGGVVQGVPIVGVAGGLGHGYDEPVVERSMTSAVVHHAAFRRERSVVAVIVGILLPVVRIFQRLRIGLISSEISRRRR